MTVGPSCWVRWPLYRAELCGSVVNFQGVSREFPRSFCDFWFSSEYLVLQKVCDSTSKILRLSNATMPVTVLPVDYTCETNGQRKVRSYDFASRIRGISPPHLPFAAGLSDHRPRCCRAFALRLQSKLLQAAEAAGGQALFWCPKFKQWKCRLCRSLGILKWFARCKRYSATIFYISWAQDQARLSWHCPGSILAAT